MEICRLCLDLLQENNFTKLDDIYKGIIKNIIPKMKLDLTFQPVICNQCSTLVDESNKFKTLCLESQQQLKQKLTGQNKSNLTAKEILHGLSTDKVIARVKERICQTCLESITCESFTILNPTNPDVYLDSMLTICLSELDLRISQNPVMCEKCLNSLQKFYHFKTTCLDVEDKLNKYIASHGTIAKFPISLLSLLESLQDNLKSNLKLGNVTDVKTVKHNDIDINSENSKDMIISSIVQDSLKTELKLSSIANFKANKFRIKTEKQVDEIDSNSKEPEDMDICSSFPGSTKTVLKLSSIVDVKPEKLNLKTENHNNDVDADGYKDMEICQEEVDIKLEEDNYDLFGDERRSNKKEPNKLDTIMKEIMKNHKQETHYSCSQCAFAMANKRHYVMHMLTTHTTFNEETRLMHFCHLCDYKTMYKDQMKKHIENDHMEKEKLNCPFCPFTSIYSMNLRRHISIHEDMQDLVCSHPQCDFKTSYKYSLQRHEIKIHGNQCSVCHYKNRNRSAVQRHLRTVHGIYEIHQCDKCKFKTFYLLTLKRHNAREHKGMMKPNFTSVKKAKNELTAEEEEEIKSLFKE